MKRATDQILTVAQMQAAELALIDAGTTVDRLMQIAGQGAAEWVWRVAAGRAVTVLCGPGNNGGDGYVIAESLRARGLAVNVVAPKAPTTDAAKNARRALRSTVATSGSGIAGAILVDCLFGSGLSRPLSAEMALLLRDLAERHPYRIAIDLPSGVSSDDGTALNEHLPDYDLTLALGAWKFAHWLMPACQTMGHRRLVPIGVTKIAGAAQCVVKPALHRPAADAHKYTRGLCAIVAGEMPGAAQLAAQAAQRGGAGYVKLIGEGISVNEPDCVVVDTPVETALSDQRTAAVLIGPGMGRNDGARVRLQSVLAKDIAAVLDADALMLLRPPMLHESATYVATPHEGELAALCKSFAIIAASKREKVVALAKASRMVIIAKGPDTIIAAPDGRVGLAPPASSWLSVAGSGDVLAGIVTSRLANGAEAMDAACEAVWLHGEAARLAGGPFTASRLAGKVAEAYAACL